MKRLLVSLLLLTVLLLATACGGGSKEPSASPEPAAGSTTGTQGQQPAPRATPTPVPATPTPTPEPTDEPLNAEQLAALESLNSYRAVVTYASKGVDKEGKAIDDVGEITTEYTKEPPARRMTIRFTDNTDPQAKRETTEMYQIGQDMYMYAGEETGWMRITTQESPFDDPDLSMISRGDIFTDLDQMKRVRPDEKINGIDSRHYRFDEKVLTKILRQDSGAVTATGDVWIAKDGGYITKYVVTITLKDGNGGILDPSLVSGSMEMAYELQEVNGDIKIELPPEAAAGSSLPGFAEGGFPAPPDSTTQMAGGQMVMLQSKTPTQDVVAFYEAALAAAGWTKNEQGSMTFEDMSSLAFTKGDLSLSLIITRDSATGLTQIMATIQP